MSIKDLIKNAVEGKASEFEETFASIMSQKMEDAVTVKYDDMFEEGYKKKMKEEDESDEDEDDEDEDEDEDLDEGAVVTHKWYSVKHWKDGSDHFDNLDDHLRGHTAKHAQTGNTSRDRPDHHFGIPVKAKSAISYMDRYAKPVSESVELDNGVER